MQRRLRRGVGGSTKNIVKGETARLCCSEVTPWTAYHQLLCETVACGMTVCYSTRASCLRHGPLSESQQLLVLHLCLSACLHQSLRGSLRRLLKQNQCMWMMRRGRFRCVERRGLNSCIYLHRSPRFRSTRNELPASLEVLQFCQGI